MATPAWKKDQIESEGVRVEATRAIQSEVYIGIWHGTTAALEINPRQDSTMYTGNNDSGNLNSRYQSYQQGGSSYIPPGRSYAEQQTNVVQDSVKTQYQAEATANTVLTQMHTQRHQLQGAHDDVWKMREATEKAKREIEDLAAKRRQQRFRLYGIIAILGTVDLLLFLRIVKCGGSFFC